MIVHKHEFVFVHIPKTAGTSINHALLTNLTGHITAGTMASLPNQLREKYGLTGSLKHGTSLEIQECITKEKWDKYYKVAFIRNPWDRAVSAYYWAKKYKGFFAISFDEYVELIEKHHKDATHPLYILLRSQASFITGVDGTIMVDDVFPFEKLSLGLNAISSKTRLNINNIKKHNTTKKHKPYKDYYTPTTQNIIQECYKDDIQLLNYKF